MIPALFAILRTYMPYVVWPAAALVGVIGYNVESIIRGDKQQPWRNKSTFETRQDRRLQENESRDLTEVDLLKDRTFVPKDIFQKNK